MEALEMLPPPARLRACALVLPTPPQGGSGAYETVCARTPKIQSRAKKRPNGMANIRHSRAGGNPASGYLRARRQESAHMAKIRHSRGSGNPAQIERGTRTLQCRAARGYLRRSAKRALAMRDSGFRRNDEVGGRNDEVGGRNDGVGFIRWMCAGFLRSLESGDPWRTRVSRFSSLRLRNGLGRGWGRHVD